MNSMHKSELLHLDQRMAVKIGAGNGNPLQYSCLKNPRDGGAWWVAIYGVMQSRTRLNDLAAAAGNLLFFCAYSFYKCIMMSLCCHAKKMK